MRKARIINATISFILFCVGALVSFVVSYSSYQPWEGDLPVFSESEVNISTLVVGISVSLALSLTVFVAVELLSRRKVKAKTIKEKI